MSIQSEINRIKADKADIRAAITEKGQSVSAAEPLSSYGDKIRAIQAGPDTSDATAAAGDILSGKTAYVKGTKVTGTIASKGAADLTASGAAVTVPAGYYPSQVSKSVASAARAAPSITVSANGLITASVTQTAGYVASGTESAVKQLTTQAAQTITPGTAAKTAAAAGRYTTGAVTVAGDANLVAGNIKRGVSIFGVAGSYTGDGSGSADAGPTTVKFVAQNVLSLKAFYTSDNTSLTDDLSFDFKGVATLSVYGPFVLSASPKTFGKSVVCLGENVVIKEISTGCFLVLPTASSAMIAMTEK